MFSFSFSTKKNPIFPIGASAQANIAGKYHNCNIIAGPNAAHIYTVRLTNGAQYNVPASSLRAAQPSAAPVPVATSVPVVAPVATATYPTTSVPANGTSQSKAPLDDVPVASYPTPAAGIYPPVPAAAPAAAAVPVANQAPVAVTGVAVNPAAPAPKTVSSATITVTASKKAGSGSKSISGTIDSTATDLNRQMDNLNKDVNKYLGKSVGNFLFGSKKKKTKKPPQPKQKFTVTTTTSVQNVNGKRIVTKSTTKTPVLAATEQRLNVVVPAGCVPGQMLTITTPTGKLVTVQIPLGVYAGQSFQVVVR